MNDQATQAPAEGDVLAKALERMDRARSILTDDNPRPECNWGMLDTADLRAASKAQPKVTATREAFEAWCVQNCYPTSKVANAHDEDGNPVYTDPRTHAAWFAVQDLATQAPAPAPAGYKLVPINPTPEILQAIFANERDARAAWMAALDFAPAVQAPAVGAEPAPNDWRLPADLKAGHVTFRKGVHCSALVSRMKMLHEAAFGVDNLTPEQKAENLAALQACKRPPHELAPPPPAATLTISVEGSTTTIDCDWGDVVRALPPGTYPLRLSQPPVQQTGDAP